jgi:endo-1,4-beta-xylanase
MLVNKLLADAGSRIGQFRSADFGVRMTDMSGTPVANARLDVRLTRHEFKFGCNAYLLGAIHDASLQSAYEERFASLLNYATLPFYWGSYEKTKDAPQEDRLRRMAEWCLRNNIVTKGHPLVWHEVWPAWAQTCGDAEMLGRLERRVTEIVTTFRSKIGVWDVVNEATVAHKVGNAVGRWMAELGPQESVSRALQWARKADPSATLLYNDFNVCADFENLVESVLGQGAPLDAVGIQSHMHKGTRPLDWVWQACETYARFGLPLHWTEVTVLSGRLKSPDDNDWHAIHEDWSTTPEGEAAQADYGEAFYKLLFSHPAVEAITWWDFSDLHSWQGAPAGLVRDDMSPKPLYERLHQLIHKEWSTRSTVTTDSCGVARVRAFFGEHEFAATLPNGDTKAARATLSRRGPRSLDVRLSAR